MLKKKFKILFVLVALFTLVCTFSYATIEPRTSDEEGTMPIAEGNGNSLPDDVTSGDDLQDNLVNNDLFLVGDKVNITDIVDGNVFVFANEVVVSGQIGGDLFVCAKKLTIDEGYVYTSLFATASDIIVNGIVYDIYAISNNFTLSDNAYVYRDLKVSANTVNLNGKVGRDAYLTAATYNITSENGTLVGGNLHYSAKSEINIPEQVVTGQVFFNKEVVSEENLVSRIFSYVFDAINGLVYTFVIILLALWLAPKFVNRVSSMSTKKAFVSLGIGIVAPMAIIFALLLLLFSTVCTNVSVAATFLFIAVCMSGTAFANIYFGALFAKLVNWDGKLKFVLASLISSLIIWAISQIPFIGGFVGFFVALFGIGTLIVNVVYRKEEAIEAKTIE